MGPGLEAGPGRVLRAPGLHSALPTEARVRETAEKSDIPVGSINTDGLWQEKCSVLLTSRSRC